MLSAQKRRSLQQEKGWSCWEKQEVGVAGSAISGSSDKIPYRGQTRKWADLKNYLCKNYLA